MISVASSITQRHSWLPRVGLLKGPAAAGVLALYKQYTELCEP